jgi:hypothetical protein
MAQQHNVTGKVGDISYTISQQVIDDLKKYHGLDAVKEVKEALQKELKKEKK